MSGDYIPELVQQLTTERNELAIRQRYLTEAIDALYRVYPAALPPAAQAAPVARMTTVDLGRELADLAGGMAAPATPAPSNGKAPARVNNQKPRVKTAEPKAAPKVETPAPPPVVLDALDQEILTALRRYGSLTATEISLKVAKGVSSVHYRLQGLMEARQVARGDEKRYVLVAGH